jgi:hypothetical protein
VILFLRVKWPGRDVDQSVSSGVEVKNDQSYISSALYAFSAWAGKLRKEYKS